MDLPPSAARPRQHRGVHAEMKLVTFSTDGNDRLGLLLDDMVVDLKIAARERNCEPQPFEDMIAFLKGGRAAHETAAAVARTAKAGDPGVCRLDQVRLRAPVPRPGKLFCLAGNYARHIEEGGGRVEAKDKVTPRLFLKPPANTVIGPGDPIVLPPVARGVDWEAELAVVIGKKGKCIAREQAFDYVAGYTAMNDVSERKFQIRRRPDTSEWDAFFDWLNGKWFDSFAPMGPCLVTADEIGDPHALEISLRVNGETKQNSTTGHMIHRIDDLIEYISKFITLEPGDIIATGTPEGTGDPVGTYLKPGDAVCVEIENIGVLENPVAEEGR